MAETLVHVTGLSDLQKFLDELPNKLAKNVMRGGLRAGALVIKDAAKSMVPVGPPSAENVRLYGSYAGALRDSLRVGTRIKGSIVTSYIKAGGKNGKKADAYYANMVEFGTSAHVISAKNGGALSFGGGFVQHVEHPGTQARPFMRPALDSQAANAVVATAEYIKQRLSSKEGLDTSDVNIEVEV